jgi:hypothetical protein
MPFMEEKSTFFGLDVNSKNTPIILFGLVVVLWAACWIFVPLIYNEPEKRGVFGDMFGVVNALFSGLAFAGLIYTILLQREELKAQREELVLTREELKGQKEELQAQRKEFQKQNTTLKRQRFENMFISMLVNHSTIVKDIRYVNSRFDRIISYTGTAALNQCLKDYAIKVNGFHTRYVAHRNAHIKVFSNIYDSVSPYFQSLIALHTAIVDANFKPKAKERYCKMLAAYVSTSERRFLYYYLSTVEDGIISNALLKVESDLDILKTLSFDNLLDKQHAFLWERFIRER